jgi:hypothetical protein
MMDRPNQISLANSMKSNDAYDKNIILTNDERETSSGAAPSVYQHDETNQRHQNILIQTNEFEPNNHQIIYTSSVSQLNIHPMSHIIQSVSNLDNHHNDLRQNNLKLQKSSVSMNSVNSNNVIDKKERLDLVQPLEGHNDRSHHHYYLPTSRSSNSTCTGSDNEKHTQTKGNIINNNKKLNIESETPYNISTSAATLQGKRGDGRMNRAVVARLHNPQLSLYEALIIGGFHYPLGDINTNAIDDENITLGQRKNQLNRRLRLLRRQRTQLQKEQSQKQPKKLQSQTHQHQRQSQQKSKTQAQPLTPSHSQQELSSKKQT